MMIYGFRIFYIFLKKNKILSLQNYLKKDKDGKFVPIYKKHMAELGLIESYGQNLIEAIKKRDQIAIESFKYMQKKTEGLSF